MWLHYLDGTRTEASEGRQFSGRGPAKEALARLNADEGDTVVLTETTDGGFRLTATHPGFAEKMAVAERLSRRYRNALRELAR